MSARKRPLLFKTCSPFAGGVKMRESRYSLPQRAGMKHDEKEGLAGSTVFFCPLLQLSRFNFLAGIYLSGICLPEGYCHCAQKRLFLIFRHSKSHIIEIQATNVPRRRNPNHEHLTFFLQDRGYRAIVLSCVWPTFSSSSKPSVV